MRSQLTDANISNINGGNWVAKYSYHDNGDMAYRTIQSNTGTFSYDGHQMTAATGDENFSLDYDENGNMIENAFSKSLKYSWDNKLRCAKSSNNYVFLALRYDPAGNRIYKETTNGTTKCKHIVDIVGDLPVILLEIDDSNDVIKKTYIYANSQILAQHDGNYAAPRYFYLHDRLGSVREVISTTGSVSAYLTYNPFGGTLESSGILQMRKFPFCFAGQYYDTQISQYYLRARQYDPYIGRFTSRDPVFGKFQEPMTLHAYLYCINDPVNRWDPRGLLYTPYGEGPYNLAQTQDVLDFAIMWDKAGLLGAITGHGLFVDYRPEYQGRAMFDYKDFGFSFTIGSYDRSLEASEFGNYCAGYALYYDYGMAGLGAAYTGGQVYGDRWYGFPGSGGVGFDDWGSIFWITKGALDANRRAQEWYENPSLNPLLVPGSLINDNPAQRFLDLRWEEKHLARDAQLAWALWLTDEWLGG